MPEVISMLLIHCTGCRALVKAPMPASLPNLWGMLAPWPWKLSRKIAQHDLIVGLLNEGT